MADFAKIGSEIAARRRANNLNQQALATLAGVSRLTITRLETGATRELGFNKLMRILGALRLDLRLTDANVGRPTLEDLQREAADETKDKSGSMQAPKKLGRKQSGRSS